MFTRASIGRRRPTSHQVDDDGTIETSRSTVGDTSNSLLLTSGVLVKDLDDDYDDDAEKEKEDSLIEKSKKTKANVFHKEPLCMSILPRHDVIGTALTSTQVCVSIKAYEAPPTDEKNNKNSAGAQRAAVDIVVALDCSGSMMGPPIKLCKQTLEMLVRVLGPRDRFGLVCFNSTAQITIPAQFMNHEHKQSALIKLKAIRAEGNTNISDGISLAAQEMKSMDPPNPVRSIFLLSDGQANEGIRDKEGLVSLVQSFAAGASADGAATHKLPDVLVDANGHVMVDVNGDVLRQNSKDCAERNGTCMLCKTSQTHKRVGRCFWKQWKPITQVNEKGILTVYKGYCLKPGCYDIWSVKKGLGEVIDEDTGHDRNRSSPPDGTETPKTIRVDTTTYSPPISIHCFGYGKYHDSNILQTMANASPGGSYYFVESDSNVLTAFGDAMGGILSVVAQTVVVTLAVPQSAVEKGVNIVQVYHEEAIARPNGSYTVPIGDFYAGETRDVLLEVQLANLGLEDGDHEAIPHLTATLDYTDTMRRAACTTGPPLVCSIARPEGKVLSPANHHVVTQWLRVYTARELKLADEEANRQQLEAARKRLQDVKSEISVAPAEVQAMPIVVALVQDIDLVLIGFQSKAQYNLCGSHLVKNKAMTHRRQRCSESVEGTFSAYQNSTKATTTLLFNSDKSGKTDD
jgi:Mg-chelatase subunit ChlD